MFEHAYCINLQRSSDRRESALQEFEREGIDVEFFRATDGKVEAPEGIHVSTSEWGCAESHIRVWRDIVENRYDVALVFEDDVSLVPGFMHKLEKVMQELPDDWDFVNLGAVDIFRNDIKKLSDEIIFGQSLLTHAYIITLECAKKWSYFNSNKLTRSIDIHMMYYPSNNMHLREPIAIQNNKTESTIGSLPRSFDYNMFVVKWGFIIILSIVSILLYIFRKPVLG